MAAFQNVKGRSQRPQTEDYTRNPTPNTPALMRIRFIWPGKTKDELLRALVAEYLKRLSRFVRCGMIETHDAADLSKESGRLVDAIPDGVLMVLLDVKWRDVSART